MSRKNVPAATVRTWATTPEGSKALTDAGAKFPGSRGRLDQSTLVVFHKANPRARYEPKVAEAPTVTVPVVGVDKAGRKTTRNTTVTLAEARALIGAEGKSGRLSLTALSEALSARAAAEVADQFTADAA